MNQWAMGLLAGYRPTVGELALLPLFKQRTLF